MSNTPSDDPRELLQEVRAALWRPANAELYERINDALSKLSAPQPVVLEPFTKVQQERLYQNRPANVGKGTSLADWRRTVEFIEAAHGITQKAGA